MYVDRVYNYLCRLRNVVDFVIQPYKLYFYSAVVNVNFSKHFFLLLLETNHFLFLLLLRLCPDLSKFVLPIAPSWIDLGVHVS